MTPEERQKKIDALTKWAVRHGFDPRNKWERTKDRKHLRLRFEERMFIIEIELTSFWRYSKGLGCPFYWVEYKAAPYGKLTITANDGLKGLVHLYSHEEEERAVVKAWRAKQAE